MKRCAIFALPLIGATQFAGSCAWKFSKTGNDGRGGAFTVTGVGAGAFAPALLKNWVFDMRFPLMAPQGGGGCRNIYAANVVSNGPGCFNAYFGGWDGVASCHDSVSVAVTETNFATINQHVPQIATGADVHVNNPSVAVERSSGQWYMVYTQLPPGSPARNKPGISQGPDGVSWSPNAGGANFLAVTNYSNWSNADVNGGNVLFIDAEGTFHLYFVDFTSPAGGSVFHATAPASWAAPRSMSFRGVLIDSSAGLRIVNDVKPVGGAFLMVLHANGPEVFISFAASPYGPFSAPAVLFSHLSAEDAFIVSISLVVDEAQSRVMGALYGASATAALDTNAIFAAWLQRRVLFKSADNATVMGLGAAARALGPDSVVLDTNFPSSMQGRFFLYDADFDPSSGGGGALLGVSELLTVFNGDVWQLQCS